MKSEQEGSSEMARQWSEIQSADPLWVGLIDDVKSGWYRQEADELFRDFEISANDVVLDVGCGSGGGSAKFCGERGAHVICIDVNEDKLRHAHNILQKTRARQVDVFVSDSNPLPVQSGTASKIVCMEVIEHVDDPVQFLAELVRVGKPGAQYLITVPDAVQEELQKALAPSSYFEKPNHIHVIDRDAFARMICAAGLEIEQQAHHGFYSALQWALFWSCEQQFSPPWHPVLQHWAKTWEILSTLEGGERVKQVLDDCLPKCQVIVARKPLDIKSPQLLASQLSPQRVVSSVIGSASVRERIRESFAKLSKTIFTGRGNHKKQDDDILVATQTDARLSGWFSEETQELLRGFPVTANDTVLDIGCGDAPFIKFCADQGAEVIFADIDPAKVEAVACALAGSKARTKQPLVTDGNPLQLPDASVTKIVAMEVLEHVDDPAQFMRELVRVGKPGAQYLITVPDSMSESTQRSLAHESYFQKPNHIRVFDREQFEQLIVDAGLTVERRVYYGFFWSIWWCFFWVCKQDLGDPWHPLLESWGRTWGALLRQAKGAQTKAVLDNFMPKSQAIIARKV